MMDTFDNICTKGIVRVMLNKVNKVKETKATVLGMYDALNIIGYLRQGKVKFSTKPEKTV